MFAFSILRGNTPRTTQHAHHTSCYLLVYKYNFYTKSEDFTAVVIHNVTFCFMTPCSLVNRYQHY